MLWNFQKQRKDANSVIVLRVCGLNHLRFSVIVAGDGRYFNAEAMQKIFRVLAGNGVKTIWVPKGGIMTTPAVSAAIRQYEGGKAQGGIVLTASHNPGGPGEDFGIKYNEALGQPAGEDFTEAVSCCRCLCVDYAPMSQIFF